MADTNIQGWVQTFLTLGELQNHEFIQLLETAGWKVRIRHLRPQPHATQTKRGGWKVTIPQGGTTIVTLIDPNTHSGTIGIAKCNPVDNYNKKVGVKLALSRALERISTTDVSGMPWRAKE